jgi:hypothetical protein
MGVPVRRGAAHAFERNRAFGAVAAALDLRPSSAEPSRARIGRLLVGAPSGPRSQARLPLADVRSRVVEEIVDLVEASCADAPLVMMVEDLHWADESSLAAIRSIVHELSNLPLLLAATFQPAPRTAELDLLLDAWMASGARGVPLRPLAPEDVAALVEAHLGAPAGPLLSSIAARAGGNPLWLVELLRSLSAEGWLRKERGTVEATADELPATLRDLVLRRLRYLPPATPEVLQLAAVLGESVSVHDLAAVPGRVPREVVADLAEAFRARLLGEREEGLVFRHQLVQQAIYEHLPSPLRRAMHRDAAGTLGRAGGDLANVAGHLMQGADRGDHRPPRRQPGGRRPRRRAAGRGSGRRGDGGRGGRRRRSTRCGGRRGVAAHARGRAVAAEPQRGGPSPPFGRSAWGRVSGVPAIALHTAWRA